MAAPPQLQALLQAVNALLRKRRYHAALALIKGFRNGIVYGVKIRAPHAFVMTFLFRSGRPTVWALWMSKPDLDTTLQVGQGRQKVRWRREPGGKGKWAGGRLRLLLVGGGQLLREPRLGERAAAGVWGPWEPEALLTERLCLQPPGQAAGHPAGHLHPLLEPGLLRVRLQGPLCAAVAHAGQDLPGALVPGRLHRGLPGVWRQQQHQQPDQHVPDLARALRAVPPGRAEGLHPRAALGPVPLVHGGGLGAGPVALRVPPAHAAALPAVLHDLPLRGQQRVARPLGLPHLQQEPPRQVAWLHPAAGQCPAGSELAPPADPPGGSCVPSHGLTLRRSSQSSICGSTSPDCHLSVGTSERCDQGLRRAEDSQARFQPCCCPP